MSDSIINDIRDIQSFKKITFSKYKKTDVKKSLIQCILKESVEESCYFCSELICSGHFIEIWEIILLIVSKHIHLSNPKLPYYIYNRFENFKNIMSTYKYFNELELRNDSKIRKLFVEIVCILCYSKKSHIYEKIKIDDLDFDMITMQKKLKAPSVDYAGDIFKSEDPKELFISINELSYNIKEKNILKVCYWIEWILKFESKCKKRRDKLICERRSFVIVEEKHQKDIIWMIWEVILSYKNKNKLCHQMIDSLFNLFCIRYTTSVKSKRRFILYFCVSLLCSNVNYNIPIIVNDNIEKIDIIKSNIDKIYMQIKENEIRPKTDYLFYGTKKDRAKRSLDKMKKMNELIGFKNE